MKRKINQFTTIQVQKSTREILRKLNSKSSDTAIRILLNLDTGVKNDKKTKDNRTTKRKAKN
jgi:hypothetical protein